MPSTRTAKARSVLIQAENIPLELRQRNQWVCFRFKRNARGEIVTNDKGRLKKEPVDPHTGRLAKSNDRSSWASFDHALRVCREKSYDGLWFVLTPDDPFLGIDLDDCMSDGHVEQWAADIARDFNSYTESSPSETGIHILIKAKYPSRKNGQVEIYSKGFFSVTGAVLSEFGTTIKSKQKALDRFSAEHFGAVASNASKTRTTSDNGIAPEPIPADQLKELLQCSKARAIYSGESNGEYASQSEADLALCRIAILKADQVWTDGQLRTLLTSARAQGRGRRKGEGYYETTILKVREDSTPAVRGDNMPKVLEDVSVSRGVPFPLEVYPQTLQTYLQACADSIHCPVDLLAVPLLGVAGAAIGRANRRLRVKESHVVSSCIWAACLDTSGGGKTPALNFLQNFVVDEQTRQLKEWNKHKEEYESDPENNAKPGPEPTLLLTDTTVEIGRKKLRCPPEQEPRKPAGSQLAVQI